MQLEQSVQPTQPLVPHPPEERGILAPKQGGFEKKKEIKLQDKGYDDFLKGICEQIDKECDERAEVRARQYTKAYNYWMGGERRWDFINAQGKYTQMDRKVAKRLFSNNQFAYQVRTVISTVMRSHSRLNVSPAPAVSGNEEKVSGAKIATRTLQHDQREKLSADFMNREWMNKVLYGVAIRGQWYAKEGSTAKARVPIIENEEQETIPGAYVCIDCGMTGPEGYADNHSSETDHEVQTFPGQKESVPKHKGYEEIQDGDCLTYGISPYEFDLAPEARDIASSPYARWQREVRKTKLKRAYPKLDLESLGSGETPVMLRAQKASKKNSKEETNKPTTVLKTYWLSPDEYFEFASRTAFDSISGYQIPAGTVLSDMCPQGMRVDIADGKIIDGRPEVKENCLSMSIFQLDPLSWSGKGLSDAVELQRWIDDIWTLYVQIQMRDALAITTFDKEMLSNGKFTGEVGSVVGVDVPQDGSGRKLSDATNVIQGNQPNQSIFAGLEYAQNSQIKAAGGFDAISGAGQSGSETARGRIIQRDMGLQGLGVPLFLSARHDVIWATQNLKIKKKNWTSERYVPYLSEGEPLGGRWFSASDIDTDFIIDVEADSWMPLTRMDEIDNMTTMVGGESALGTIPGGFTNTELIPKAIRIKAAQLLNVPSGTDPDEKDLRVARHRYSILKQAVEKITEQGTQPDDKMDQEIPPEMNSPLLVPPQMAMSIAQMPSIVPLPDVDKHEVFIEFYRDAIKDAIDSDGIENHPVTKAVLMLLIKAHENQGVMDTQAMGQMAIEAQAPQMMADQAMKSGEAQQSHGQEMEKTAAGQKHDLAKQKQGSELKQQEIQTKGKVDAKSKELRGVKV